MYDVDMNIVAIGTKLEDELFKLVQISNKLKCGMLFLKKYIPSKISINDILIVDSYAMETLPNNIVNTIVSLKMLPNYKPRFKQEIVINVCSIGSIAQIITRNELVPIATDSSTKHLLQIIRKTASTDASILLTGASGTGKMFWAKYVHRVSGKADAGYTIIECNKSNLLPELDFKKAIRKAESGTIILKNIDKLPKNLQKILSQIISIKLRPNTSFKTRFISTTSVALDAEVRFNRFSQELFFLLNVIPISLKKLNERGNDIRALAQYFCAYYSNNMKTLSDSSLNLLEKQTWNENVRELKQYIKDLVAATKKDATNVQKKDNLLRIENVI